MFYPALFVDIYIVLPVADETNHAYFTAGPDIPAAFHAYKRRDARAGIRYVGYLTGYLLPAFPSYLAQPDPVVEVCIHPSKELMEVEGISRVFYIMPWQPKPFGI